MDYTTTALLGEIKLEGMLPISQETLQDEDILVFMNNEMKTYFIPLMLRTREEFYVRFKDIDIIPGQDRYPIPARALGSKIRDIYIKDGEQAIPMGKIEPENVTFYGTYPRYGYTFYIENNDIVLLPKPSDAQKKVRLKFFFRPNMLVKTSRCGQITAIDTATKTVTVDAVPDNIVAATYADFAQNRPHFDISGYDNLIASISGTNIVLTDALPTNLMIGDYITSAGETPIPQLPYEIFPILKDRTVIKILKALGDFEGAAAKMKELTEEMEDGALTIIDNRVHGKLHKLANHNSTWRIGRRYIGRNFY